MANDLSFAIRAVNEASATLGKVEKDVAHLTQTTEKTHGPLSKMGGALGSVASIAGGFVVAQGLIALPGLLTGMAQSAAEDEAATLRMNKALELLAARSGEAGQSLSDMKSDMDARIASGQKLAFSDDDIRDSMQKLIAATDDYSEAGRRQALAMDLARGAGIPLADASKLLGKINEENVEVFKRMGITLGENATEAEALAAVQAKWGGQAAEFAASTAGGWEQSKIRLGELAEGFGTLLLPALNALVSFGNSTVLPFLEAIPAAAQAMAARFRPLFEEYIKPAFERFSVYYEENIKPALENIKTGIGAVVDFVAEHWPQILEFIQPVIEQVQLVIETAFGIVRNLIEIIIDLLGGDFSGAWSNVKDLVGVVWEGIVGTVENAIKLIANLGKLMWEAGKKLGEMLFEGLKLALGAVGGIASDIGEAISGAIKRLVNSQVIDRVNRALEFEFGVEIGGRFIGVKVDPPNIPHLAQGGIVTRPTLALIGEAGPEAVVPLSRGGMGHTFNINVTAGVGSDPVVIANTIVGIINQSVRNGGAQLDSSAVAA